jgi:hypothetical protein
MTPPHGWLSALLAAGVVAGCMTDHSQLEKKPDSSVSGAGMGGALGVSGAPAQIAGGSGGDATSGGGHADDEPPGKSVFTFVNGVVDAPSVALCFAQVGATGVVVPFGNPLSSAPLAYGKTLTLTTVAGANLATDTLQLLVIAGDLDLITGLDCESGVARAQDEEMDARADGGGAPTTATANTAEGGAAGAADAPSAGGSAGIANAAGAASTSDSGTGEGGAGPIAQVQSRLRVAGLPAIPAGTLSAGRSILLAANGCMGGPTYSGANAEEYCGAGYTEQNPTLSAVLVSLSRVVDSHHAGLQFVHASLATPQVDISSQPPFISPVSGVPIANGVVEGQVAPRPALLTHSAAEYGSNALYQIQIAAQGNVLGDLAWTDALANGGLTELANDVTYALVLVGPRADHLQPTTLWNAPAIALIPVDPE